MFNWVTRPHSIFQPVAKNCVDSGTTTEAREIFAKEHQHWPREERKEEEEE